MLRAVVRYPLSVYRFLHGDESLIRLEIAFLRFSSLFLCLTLSDGLKGLKFVLLSFFALLSLSAPVEQKAAHARFTVNGYTDDGLRSRGSGRDLKRCSYYGRSKFL